jgi:hypothetical protein
MRALRGPLRGKLAAIFWGLEPRAALTDSLALGYKYVAPNGALIRRLPPLLKSMAAGRQDVFKVTPKNRTVTMHRHRIFFG